MPKVYNKDVLKQLWFIGLIINTTNIKNCWNGINGCFFEVPLNRFGMKNGGIIKDEYR